jgi:hypothetical protein
MKLCFDSDWRLETEPKSMMNNVYKKNQKTLRCEMYVQNINNYCLCQKGCFMLVDAQ